MEYSYGLFALLCEMIVFTLLIWIHRIEKKCGYLTALHQKPADIYLCRIMLSLKLRKNLSLVMSNKVPMFDYSMFVIPL